MGYKEESNLEQNKQIQSSTLKTNFPAADKIWLYDYIHWKVETYRFRQIFSHEATNFWSKGRWFSTSWSRNRSLGVKPRHGEGFWGLLAGFWAEKTWENSNNLDFSCFCWEAGVDISIRDDKTVQLYATIKELPWQRHNLFHVDGDLNSLHNSAPRIFCSPPSCHGSCKICQDMR